MLNFRGSFGLLLKLLCIPLVAKASQQFNCSTKYEIDQFYFDFSKLDSVFSLVNNETIKPSIIETQYRINPCKQLDPIPGVPEEDQCTQNTRICQTKTTYKDNQHILYKVKELARDTPQVSMIKNEDQFSELIWVSEGGNNKTRPVTTTIRFTCGTEFGSPVIESFNSTSFSFSWKTISSCPQNGKVPPIDTSPKSGGSSVFGIFLLVMIFVYLIGGAAYNYFIIGSRGLNLIPNIEFWKEFPENFMALLHRLVTMVSGRRRGGYSSV